MTFTTAHGNAGPLTHWWRPGIEPVTSWFLVRFVSAVSQRELQKMFLNGSRFFKIRGILWRDYWVLELSMWLRLCCVSRSLGNRRGLCPLCTRAFEFCSIWRNRKPKTITGNGLVGNGWVEELRALLEDVDCICTSSLSTQEVCVLTFSSLYRGCPLPLAQGPLSPSFMPTTSGRV